MDINDKIRHTIRGCKTLPNCGEHPGTIPFVFFLILGAFVGIDGYGIYGIFIGFIIMFICIAPIYFYGAYERSKREDILKINK